MLKLVTLLFVSMVMVMVNTTSKRNMNSTKTNQREGKVFSLFRFAVSFPFLVAFVQVGPRRTPRCTDSK